MFAFAGFATGLLALFLCWIPLVGWGLSAFAIVLGAIGLRRSKAFASIGMIAGAAGVVLGLMFWHHVGDALANANKNRAATEALWDAQNQAQSLASDAQNYRYHHGGGYPVGKTPLTPAADCCRYADHLCPLNEADWSHPVWKQLDFQLFEPSAYRYSYESDGNTFVVRMVGDADCDGKSVTWVLRGAVDGSGNVQNEEPPALPEGVI